MPEPLLALHDVDFSYDSLQVLHGVSLEVHPGEILALVGTNGAGKSTVLRLAAGLERPGRGRVTYRGDDVSAVPAEQRVGQGIGLLLGGRSLFGDMTVDENLRVGTTALRATTSPAERAGRVDEVLRLFPVLERRRRQTSSSLSGGEQQMLALAKVLLLRPSLLMIDELSLGLAPLVVSELLDIVRRLRDGGTTVVLVEQSIAVAAEVADRAIHMEKGEVRFTGTPRDLLDGDVAQAVFFGGATR